MANRVHDDAGAKLGRPLGSGGKGMTTNDRAASVNVRRMFSLEHRTGLQGWWMRILLLEPGQRIMRLAYTAELYAVVAGLMLFFIQSLVVTEPHGVLQQISSMLAILAVDLLFIVVMLSLTLGFASMIATSATEMVLLLQPFEITFITIVFGAFAMKLADETSGFLRYVALTLAAFKVGFAMFAYGWFLEAPNPLEHQQQVRWLKEVFKVTPLTYMRFGSEKPRAEEMLEEYLTQMPEDVKALMEGDPRTRNTNL